MDSFIEGSFMPKKGEEKGKPPPRNLLCNGHCPKNADGSFHPERKHFFGCLCCTNVFFSYNWRLRVSPPGNEDLYRYVAICNPLHYPLVMNHKVCVQLAIASWVGAAQAVIGETYQIFSLSFCGSNTINHFFCDIPPILRLACGDIFLNEITVCVDTIVYIIVPLLLIIISYDKIIANIHKISSANGRAKAFSICSSHLIAVVLFYGTTVITYSQLKTNQSEGTGKVISLFYTVLIPTLNPIIYTLRNKDIMMTLRKLLSYYDDAKT